MAVRINQIHWEQTVDEQGKYSLSGEVIAATNIDKEIFLYQRASDGTDEYYSVCSAENLTNVQKNTPAEGSTYCRKKTMSLTYDTPQDMLDDKTDIDLDIEKLIEDWNLYLDDVIREYDQEYE